ncbi:hypothetical protein P153DRAFT_377337 [Dothidotthia symphoricarpi CBS 119687]|uniref:Uncharacterized protein n=1 Tax=Dothidotthia symphoricarpi CBS 119687 TaxID=1392245 RepID=A0A6A6A7K2_9PLEO|nr:uncharacterized protein P153DRAFT_377337 [Dothidotthia symphoricarpi CBS 119687]KAF2127839.1 hypothetical protein P153DRAFT_377337 [Dothidotthia symphoricarpi CBS 119687]
MEDVVANTAPSQQTALVEFVRTLQQQKVTDPTTGDQLRFDQDYNKTLWTEVPNFGINVADEWNFDAGDSSPDPEEETQYYNKIAFLAQLTSIPAELVSDPENHPGPFDFSLYALLSFRHAFEGTAEPRAPNRTLLRAASLWMIYAADRLWANVQMKRDFRHKASNTNPAEEGDAYLKPRKGWVGFNQERWGVWVRGLENGRNIEDQEARELVERALREVERVEDQAWRVKDEEKFA